ncbi:HTH-type transcriptional regulatory protein GabR [Pseudovibrio axinellae]|uniref:HTH-type transcriptional regulatory protein GabR n=1 Tax=Pseudovibrio axinellae TaxID=989403 RepID=A0A166BBJ3_9HYPH|nr:PLP-dependent aminotransferase family protein [Pseudovibrio axinellae]KZL22098.1 HTH-type transcriptional regulatory protein GabR [Pseudovibrio axinellae]SEQ55379.1 transcriptional regulator, GntR family [Pseudovibrio axinellae]
MRYSLFSVDRDNSSTLQSQIREMLVSAILSGQLAKNTPVPSTRALAKRLGVSRNTVMLAYQALAADGYLNTRERSGFYVSPEMVENLGQLPETAPSKEQNRDDCVDWGEKLRLTPSTQFNILKTENWHSYPYPFIYGQVDPTLFPISAWRDCVRQTMSIKWLDAWTDDRFTADDPMLIEQIQRRILIRRGVIAEPDEILVTMGAQNALFLIAHLLVKQDTPVAVEDPGYPDVRNIMQLRSADIRAIPIDEEGIQVAKLGDAKLVYVTPSHQFPTNTTMTMKRRREVLEWAAQSDALIIEDDYEYETNYRGQPTAALRSIDTSGRVLYVGSLSKSIMPGLRVGFIVAPRQVIKEVRAMRRLMLRHPPGNNQRSVALFLAQGSQDALISKLHHAYSNRWNSLSEAMARHFPGWAQVSAFGGSSFWVCGPPDLDASTLADEAMQRGILIEPGNVFFANPNQGKNYFRLGFSSIDAEKIPRGIELLSHIANKPMITTRSTRKTMPIPT